MEKKQRKAFVAALLAAAALTGGPAHAASPNSSTEDSSAAETSSTAKSEIVYAEEITGKMSYAINRVEDAPYWRAILDGVNTTGTDIPASVVISAESEVPIGGVYVEANDPVGTMHLSLDGETIDRTENTYLHFYVDGFQSRALSICFDDTVSLADIHFYTVGEKPDYIQTWNPTLEQADVMLLPAHYDDELLYFGGIIPWCMERGASVMVAFFCNHEYEVHRKHEMLDGLWEAGIRNYPILGEYHDSGIIQPGEALWRLQFDGYEWEDLLERQVRLYRQYRPQIVLTHSEDGEYGHCQHVLYEQLAIEAAELSGDGKAFPELAKEFGTYQVPKIYVHDYISDHGQIVLDLDQPLETQNGMTSYEVTVSAFKKHRSQEDYFMGWLELPQKASEIVNYSPCRWGLYCTNVGDDTSTDTFFDHIVLLKDR